MANAATFLALLQAKFPADRAGGFAYIAQYSCTFDTLATPLTIFTPVSGKNGIVLGYSYAATAAHDVSWYSGANLIVKYQMPANSQVFRGITSCEGSEIITKPGEALKVQIDTALINSMVVYVASLEQFFLYR